jgi:hypothetical protein
MCNASCQQQITTCHAIKTSGHISLTLALFTAELEAFQSNSVAELAVYKSPTFHTFHELDQQCRSTASYPLSLRYLLSKNCMKPVSVK